jgi:F-type H+-transporting ATPase subunit delta
LNASSIARRYARALFELAVEESRFEEVGRELAQASQALMSDPELKAILKNPSVAREEKIRLAEAVIAALKASPVVANTIRLLVHRARLGDIELIEQAYRALADARAGRLRAHLVSAVVLDSEASERIGSSLRAATQRNVVLDQSVDPALLGGVVATVAGTVYDGSLKTQLEDLKRQLRG